MEKILKRINLKARTPLPIKQLVYLLKMQKKQAWWKNTLIILIADHGSNLPERKEYFNAPSRFKIPMLWLGGALAKKDTIINTLSSQVDFASTLLETLHQDSSDFKWGHNIFKNTQNPYVHYTFNKGFGTMDKNGIYVYDYVSNQAIIEKGTSTKKLDSLGKAITQNTYDDFLNRK